MCKEHFDKDTATLRRYMREQLIEIKSGMISILECLLGRAETHYSVIIPAYTHLQQAQPKTMGHFWLDYYEAFSRDFLRLAAAFNSTNECPLEIGAITSYSFPLDMGLASHMFVSSTPANNNLYSVASRDYIIDYHHFATLLSTHISRLAEDFAVFSSQEFGWFTLDSSFYTSSMMPQEKNPDALELLRERTGQIIGNALDMFKTLLAYDRGQEEDKRGLFASMSAVKLMLSVLAPLISGARIEEKLTGSSLEKSNECVMLTTNPKLMMSQVLLGRDKLEKMRNMVDLEESSGGLLIGYFDGASRGNPGLAGAGAWISDGRKEPVWENSDALGEKTNNEAEYTALINLLSEFHKRGIRKAIIRGDSKLVIEQMSGRWKVNEPRLKELCKQAKLLAEEMQLTYEWIPREQNLYADFLSNKAFS